MGQLQRPKPFVVLNGCCGNACGGCAATICCAPAVSYRIRVRFLTLFAKTSPDSLSYQRMTEQVPYTYTTTSTPANQPGMTLPVALPKLVGVGQRDKLPYRNKTVFPVTRTRQETPYSEYKSRSTTPDQDPRSPVQRTRMETLTANSDDHHDHGKNRTQVSCFKVYPIGNHPTRLLHHETVRTSCTVRQEDPQKHVAPVPITKCPHRTNTRYVPFTTSENSHSPCPQQP